MPMVSTPVSSATRTQATRSRLEEQVRDGGRRTLVRMPTSLAAGGMPTHPATYCPCSADLPTEERYTYSCAARSWARTSRGGPSHELRGPTPGHWSSRSGCPGSSAFERVLVEARLVGEQGFVGG